MLIKIKQNNGNWAKALADIKEFLKEYQPNQGGYKVNVPIMPGFAGGNNSVFAVQNNSSIFSNFINENGLNYF